MNDQPEFEFQSLQDQVEAIRNNLNFIPAGDRKDEASRVVTLVLTNIQQLIEERLKLLAVEEALQGASQALGKQLADEKKAKIALETRPKVGFFTAALLGACAFVPMMQMQFVLNRFSGVPPLPAWAIAVTLVGGVFYLVGLALTSTWFKCRLEYKRALRASQYQNPLNQNHQFNDPMRGAAPASGKRRIKGPEEQAAIKNRLITIVLFFAGDFVLSALFPWGLSLNSFTVPFNQFTWLLALGSLAVNGIAICFIAAHVNDFVDEKFEAGFYYGNPREALHSLSLAIPESRKVLEAKKKEAANLRQSIERRIQALNGVERRVQAALAHVMSLRNPGFKSPSSPVKQPPKNGSGNTRNPWDF